MSGGGAGLAKANTSLGLLGALYMGAGTTSLPTRAQMIANQVSTLVTTILTSGFATVGDGGAARYVRATGPFSDGSSFQSADGAWWLLSNAPVCPEMFGAKGDGSTNDYAALQDAIYFVSSSTAFAGKVVLRPGRTYNTASQLVISGQVGLILTSEGGSGTIVGTSAISSGTAIILVQNCWKVEVSVNLTGNHTSLPNGIEFQNTGVATWTGAVMAECVVRYCTFGLGQSASQMATCIRVTDTRTSAGTNDNNSEHKFHFIHFTNFTQAGISIETFNSLQNDIDRCQFSNTYGTPNNVNGIQTTSNTTSGTERGGGGFVARHCVIQLGGTGSVGNVQFYLRGDVVHHDIQIIGCESEDSSAVIDVDISTVSLATHSAINFVNCWSLGPTGGGSTGTATAGAFVVGRAYTIVTVGTTDFTLVGAASNTVGAVFTATGVGTGTGTASAAPCYISANTGASPSTLTLNFTNCGASQGCNPAIVNLARAGVTMNVFGGNFTATTVTGAGNLTISGAVPTIGNNNCNFANTINLNCIFFNSTFQVGGVSGFNGMPFYSTKQFNFENSASLPSGSSLILNTTGSPASLAGGLSGSVPILKVNGNPALVSDGTNYSTATAGTATLPANPLGFIEVQVFGGAHKIPFYGV